MKYTFKKEINFDIDMNTLMNECMNRFEYYQRNLARGLDNRHLEDLIRERLELGYDANIDLCDYDNTNEVLQIISKNLLVWCLEHNHTEEYLKLKELY